MSEVHAYLEKAARSLDAARVLLANGDADFAASRAYYGCFYVAESLLFDEGLSVSTHAGVIGEYGRLFEDRTAGSTIPSSTQPFVSCSAIRRLWHGF